MSQNFQPGDFLVLQLESAFALLRVLVVDENQDGRTWHVAAYGDFFPDVDTAETAATQPSSLSVSYPHIALTNRAFESTQVAKITSLPLVGAETAAVDMWRDNPDREVSDRSVRLMLGLR